MEAGRAWVGVVIAGLAALGGGRAQAQALPSDEMRAHFIDVGQGDATLLEFSCGAVLIDAGGETNAEFDSTEELLGYLEAFFERRTDLKGRLDALILSHPHIDHTRGVRKILEQYKPRNVVTNGQQTGSGKSGQLAAQSYAAATEETSDTSDDVGYLAVTTAKISGAGLTTPVLDPLGCPGVDPGLVALWGRVPQNPGWTAKEFKNANNHSVVVRVEFGAASFLFTGDLETDGIKALVAKFKDTGLLDVDVYKVGHHGAANATTAPLLSAISPKLAVLMNGPKEREVPWTAWAYGHPRKAIIDLMQPKVALPRKPAIQADVATGVKAFVTTKVTRGIYSTSWDGTVVVQAKADGTITLLPAAGAPLDLNSATVAALAELPGLGVKRAEAIVKYRAAQGSFSSVEELTKVRGIGPATLAAIEDLVGTGNQPVQP